MLKNEKRFEQILEYAEAFTKLNAGKEVDIIVILPTTLAIKMQEELMQVALNAELECKRLTHLGGEAMYCTFTGIAQKMDVAFISATIAEYAPKATVALARHDGTQFITIA